MDIINTKILKEIMQTEKRRAEELLPELIKRLIVSSVKDIISVRVPDKDDIWAPGFDGIIEVKESTLHVSDGISVWEFGACNEPLTKIEDDYEKRTQNVLGINKSEATFYLVMPTIWAYKDKTITEWENEHKEGWKRVHVIDASEVCDWINSIPSVCAWLLENYYDKRFLKFKSITEAFKNFSSKTSPALSKNLFLQTRDEERGKLYKLINKPIIRIKGQSFYDAYGFTLTALGEEVNLNNTSIVVYDIETFQVLDRFVKDKLFLFGFPCNNDVNSENNNRVILCFNSFEKSIKEDITIGKQSKLTFESALKEMGVSNHNAMRLCNITNRNIVSLIRQIPGSSNMSQPEWGTYSSLRNIIPLLFMGKINKTSEEDKEIAAQLLGEDYQKFEVVAKDLMKFEDSPIKEVEGIYAIANYEEVWEILGLNTSDVYFNNLITTIKQYIGSYNSKRYSFNISLIKNLVNNLVYFSEVGQTDCESVKSVINMLLSGMLGCAEWGLIFELTQIFSKAAPEVIVQCFENDLKEVNSVIRDSFKSNDYNNDYCKILWTLESLMWFEESKIRACKMLFELYYCNFSYRISNTPEESLLNELCLWNAKSGLSIDEKRAILLKEMERQTEQIGLFAMKVITRKTCYTSIGATETEKEEKEITNKQYYDALIDITEKVMGIITHTKSINLFISLIEKYLVVKPELFSYMVNEIDYSGFDINGLQLVRFTILKKIANIQKRNGEYAIYIPYLRNIADKIKSDDLLLCYLPYFQNVYECPILDDENEDDYMKLKERKYNYRVSLYNELQKKYGEDVILQLIDVMTNDSYWGNFVFSVLSDKSCNIKCIFDRCVKEGKYILLGRLLDQLDYELIIKLIPTYSIKDQIEILKWVYREDVDVLLTSNELASAYWSKKRMLEFNQKIFDNLLKYNPSGLLAFYYLSGINTDNISNVFLVLDKIANLKADELHKSGNEYCLDELLTRLDKNYYTEKIALLEIEMVQKNLIEGQRYGINRYYFENPSKLSELLDDNQQYSYKRYNFMTNINFPDIAFEYYEKFERFCDGLVNASKDKKRAICFLGEMFGRSANIKNLSFPHEFIARIIEKYSNEDLDISVLVGKTNSSGARWVNDGSDQIEIANKLKAQAKGLELDYPRTARILRRMAETHLRDAKYDRIHSELGWD